MSMIAIVLLVLVVMIVGLLPTWRHSRNWGYGPSSCLGMTVVVLTVLLLMGRI